MHIIHYPWKDKVNYFIKYFIIMKSLISLPLNIYINTLFLKNLFRSNTLGLGVHDKAALGFLQGFKSRIGYQPNHGSDRGWSLGSLRGWKTLAPNVMTPGAVWNDCRNLTRWTSVLGSLHSFCIKWLFHPPQNHEQVPGRPF